jgi:hypothetical protein
VVLIPFLVLDMSSNILQEVEPLHALGEVLHWAFSRRPQVEMVTVVTQDEYTHDVVMRVSPNEYLVFDTT